MLDMKPNSAFLPARNSARQVVNSAQNSAEILLWLLMLSTHFPTHATCKYLGAIQDSRYEDQVGQFCGNDATHSLGPSNLWNRPTEHVAYVKKKKTKEGVLLRTTSTRSGTKCTWNDQVKTKANNKRSLRLPKELSHWAMCK